MHELSVGSGLAGKVYLHGGQTRRNGNLGGVWWKGDGLSAGSEATGRFSRVPRAAPRLQMQPDELPVTSDGLTKTGRI